MVLFAPPHIAFRGLGPGHYLASNLAGCAEFERNLRLQVDAILLA